MIKTSSLSVDGNIFTSTTTFNVSNEFLSNNTYADTLINETIDTAHEKFDFYKHLKTNIIMALTFSLFLHNNNNFTRKVVLEVQEHVSQYVVKPLLDTVMNLAKSSFQYEQPSLYNDFSILVSNLRNPFKLFDSDYKLYNFLKNEGYVTNFKEVQSMTN